LLKKIAKIFANTIPPATTVAKLNKPISPITFWGQQHLAAQDRQPPIISSKTLPFPAFTHAGTAPAGMTLHEFTGIMAGLSCEVRQFYKIFRARYLQSHHFNEVNKMFDTAENSREMDSLFADECPDSADQPVQDKEQSAAVNSWKVLIVDDEIDIHRVTEMALADFAFDGKTIEFINAYSGQEAMDIFATRQDIAVVLLDVVMESTDSGLKVVEYVRSELNNQAVRIILRTGYPGRSPEKEVIQNYDINDYRTKTELTSTRLYTSVTAALRSYRDMKTIEQARAGVELIIASSANLYEVASLKKFTIGVLDQLIVLLNLEDHAICLQTSGVAISAEDDGLAIMAATGRYKQYQDKKVAGNFPEEVLHRLHKVIEAKESIFVDDVYIGYFRSINGSVNLVYLDGCNSLTKVDKSLINIFSVNIAISFDNVFLNKEIIDTQKEVINTLGEVVETRSQEAAQHVVRVAEFAYLLAIESGMKANDAELLRLAAPMHDVGKIGIPDNVLNKPGRFTSEEFEVMKNHTTIGYDILKKSDRDIMQTAALVALQHHERWDGGGYPNGLAGEDIHIHGRIAAIADVFDALSHKRVYKDSWPMAKIIDLFKKERGQQFDPELVDSFLNNLSKLEEINQRYPNE